MLINQAASLYLDSLQSNYSAGSTLRKYSKVMRMLSEVLDGKAVRNITPRDLQQYRKSRNISALTSAKELQIIKAFFAWCTAQGYSKANIAQGIKPPKVRQAEKIPYTQQEVIQIIAACDKLGQESYERRRAMAAILLMRFTGCRISDVLNLRLDAVKDGVLRLYTQKTKQLVMHDLNIIPPVLHALAALPLPKGTIAHTHYFWNGVGSNHAVMSDMQRSLRRVYLLSKVPHAHNHRFRHTYASDLLSNGASLWVVARQLGISTTICERVYGHLTAAYCKQVEDATMRAFSADYHTVPNEAQN